MSRNDNITDIGKASLTEGCSELKTIDLACCSQLTNASLAAVGATCRGLTSIYVRGSGNMTDDGIASLTQGCSQLRTINRNRW